MQMPEPMRVSFVEIHGSIPKTSFFGDVDCKSCVCGLNEWLGAPTVSRWFWYVWILYLLYTYRENQWLPGAGSVLTPGAQFEQSWYRGALDDDTCQITKGHMYPLSRITCNK